MIEEQGIVKGFSEGNVLVKVQRNSACHSCELSGGCGVGSICRLLGYRPQQFSIRYDKKLKIGDRVVIGLAEPSYVKAGFLIYLLPLISLFVFAGITDYLFQSLEWLHVIAAVIGLFVGLWIAGKISSTHFSAQFQPKIIRQIW